MKPKSNLQKEVFARNDVHLCLYCHKSVDMKNQKTNSKKHTFCPYSRCYTYYRLYENQLMQLRVTLLQTNPEFFEILRKAKWIHTEKDSAWLEEHTI